MILLVNPSHETNLDGQTPAIGFVIFIYVNTILQGFQGKGSIFWPVKIYQFSLETEF